MESSSEANRINISGVTYDLVKHLYEFDYRGKIDAKGTLLSAESTDLFPGGSGVKIFYNPKSGEYLVQND